MLKWSCRNPSRGLNKCLVYTMAVRGGEGLFVVYSTRRFVLCLTLCHFVLVLFSPFSIAITSLGEEIANLSAFLTFVQFVLVCFCRFPLPLGVWEGLRFVIVALPGLFSYFFFFFFFFFFFVTTRNRFSPPVRFLLYRSKAVLLLWFTFSVVVYLCIYVLVIFVLFWIAVPLAKFWERNCSFGFLRLVF